MKTIETVKTITSSDITDDIEKLRASSTSAHILFSNIVKLLKQTDDVIIKKMDELSKEKPANDKQFHWNCEQVKYYKGYKSACKALMSLFY
jgi:predicted KAP-like P-loop ATPase